MKNDKYKQSKTIIEDKENLRQIKLIVENSYDAIISETLDGIITSWNGGASRMFGYLAEDMIGKSIILLFPDEIKDELKMVLDKVKKGDYIADFDSVRLCKDGSTVEVSLSVSPIRLENGTITGASVIERDITERRMSERKIRDLNEVRNKFISIISHQLRTPLTVLNWNLEALLNGEFGRLEDVTRQFLKATYDQSVEITHRIHDLLEAMDIEEGRIIVQLEEAASLNSIIASVVIKMKDRAVLKRISLLYKPPSKDLPAMDIDIEKIRTVVYNLIENAIVYNNEGGSVTVKLSAYDKTIRFEVTDNGIGVPEQEQHHIFTRFFRASNASAMQPDAFGLGLFISKSFIEQHDGTVGFASKEGIGSTFWFEIPLKVEV